MWLAVTRSASNAGSAGPAEAGAALPRPGSISVATVAANMPRRVRPCGMPQKHCTMRFLPLVRRVRLLLVIAGASRQFPAGTVERPDGRDRGRSHRLARNPAIRGSALQPATDARARTLPTRDKPRVAHPGRGL